MVPAAFLPAVALIAGAAGGIAIETSWRVILWLLPLLLIVASVAWRLRRPAVTCVSTVFAFACCGFVLGSDARQKGMDTPLRLVLDGELGGFRVGSSRLPEGSRPIPTRLRLAEDASVDDNLTTLRARVLAIRPHDVWRSAEGDVVINVSGSASHARADQWRRGRILEAPVLFRRPARYLNEGVADFERDAALDGISLLGSVKSGLLMDVGRPATAVGEFAADVRAY